MILSIGKIFWLLVILWGVWTGFRMIERRAKNQKPAPKNTPKDTPKDAPKDGPDSMDMRECTRCKSWVSSAGCDRPDCPIKAQ